MNKRIRKKKAKQQLIRAISGLVEAAEEMQREQERRTRQAGISYIKYIEAVRERQYGISILLSIHILAGVRRRIYNFSWELHIGTT